MIDGRRTLSEVLASTAGMGVTRADMEQLIASGLVAEVQPPDPPDKTDLAPVPVSARTSQERYRDAYPVATRITAGLGLRGFRLNLAVEAAGSFEQLAELAPKIQQAVGPEKFAALNTALHG